jgi:hypothetical protein
MLIPLGAIQGLLFGLLSAHLELDFLTNMMIVSLSSFFTVCAWALGASEK